MEITDADILSFVDKMKQEFKELGFNLDDVQTYPEEEWSYGEATPMEA